ncbi:uncharacterized protein LOC131614590 [Vicia villosa]|uniref:uncharacterized protein LOC131614590 n=1 Tax=Vicia villosa TaxID=3911 RepID=UPI00273B4FF8|nr:uncharacterized protein LOC131614590 [Vicia villosa]
MKSILRGFELMSELRVNFLKSNFYAVNVGEWLLNAASEFLSCKIGFLPFKFLGVKVGDSPRKLTMWKELIAHLKKRLAVWRGFHINIAGKVVLINSVLNMIPIYSLSFYKAPSKVLKEIKSMQSKFLWNGRDDKKSIHWVGWNTVCKTCEQGGLGVKNMEILNVALLRKWKWRLLTEKEAVWSGIINHRYDNSALKILVEDVSVVSKQDSIWWRDVLISGNYVNLEENHFAAAGSKTARGWQWHEAQQFLPGHAANTNLVRQLLEELRFFSLV